MKHTFEAQAITIYFLLVIILILSVSLYHKDRQYRNVTVDIEKAYTSGGLTVQSYGNAIQ